MRFRLSRYHVELSIGGLTVQIVRLMPNARPRVAYWSECNCLAGVPQVDGHMTYREFQFFGLGFGLGL